MSPELRQLRYFVAVAERRSFTRAAEDLYVAQQALSQQIKAMEELLGVRLLERSSRRVELTVAGRAYLTDCRKVLAAAARADHRVRAVAAGESGRLRVAHTVTAGFDTVPLLTARLGAELPALRIEAREVFAGDVCRVLRDDRADLAVAPESTYPDGLAQRPIRGEDLLAAVGDGHPLAAATELRLGQLADEPFELWPREMAPGYYDAVVGACRAAGFEPAVDPSASGSTAWANIAAGRGVNLIARSLAHQAPRGITLVPIARADPAPRLRVCVVWREDRPHPALEHVLRAYAGIAGTNGWQSP